jgi:hypothetical protein
MPTPPVSTETLTPEQKANRELAASLLDAHFNLAKSLAEAESKLAARKDAAVKEFAKANGVDAIIAVSKNVATAIDQLQKDVAALKQSPKLVTECLTRLKKDSPDIVRDVLKERKAKDEQEIKTRTDGRAVFEKDLEFVEKELKGLPSKDGAAATNGSVKKRGKKKRAGGKGAAARAAAPKAAAAGAAGGKA